MYNILYFLVPQTLSTFSTIYKKKYYTSLKLKLNKAKFIFKLYLHRLLKNMFHKQYKFYKENSSQKCVSMTFCTFIKVYSQNIGNFCSSNFQDLQI